MDEELDVFRHVEASGLEDADALLPTHWDSDDRVFVVPRESKTWLQMYASLSSSFVG